MSLSCGESPRSKVIIGIPTYKRPQGLSKLLESITKLECSNIELSVVVAENDQQHRAGAKLVTKVSDNYPLPLASIDVSQRGISFVRNALLDAAFLDYEADFLVMVDDDEWVESKWLNALLETHFKTGCEVVGGNTLAEFEGEPPSWTKALAIYFPEQASLSQEIPLLESSASVLLHKCVYFGFGQQRFDPFYSVYGGGDKEYFTRLKAQGIKFASAHTAISHELFDGARVTKRWAQERAFRIGAADMRIILLHHRSNLLSEIIKILLATLVGASGSLLSLNSRSRMKYWLLLQRQLGKLSGLLNKQKPVYEKVHGK